MNDDQTAVTRYLLQFCYTCQWAGQCTEEAAAENCMLERGFAEAEAEEADETRRLLTLYME